MSLHYKGSVNGWKHQSIEVEMIIHQVVIQSLESYSILNDDVYDWLNDIPPYTDHKPCTQINSVQHEQF